MRELTPKQIVRELDKYIVGQAKAKKAESKPAAPSEPVDKNKN